MANRIDIVRLRAWIGKEDEKSDVVTPGLIERLRATLGSAAADGTPPGIHWCLAPAAVPPDRIGPDGHPCRGGFLPPVPLPRRMWVGGALEFHRPLQAGDLVRRTSRIADVVEKAGRSGHLVFVTVQHVYVTEAGPVINERQDIVYREDRTAEGKAGSTANVTDAPAADHSETVDASRVLLFRYSALTFNGHRIHYDSDYARDIEGYPGLVVHAPLQATLLANFASRLARRELKRFSYRAVAPLFEGSFTLNATQRETGFDLWTAVADGHRRMEARAEF